MVYILGIPILPISIAIFYWYRNCTLGNIMEHLYEIVFLHMAYSRLLNNPRSQVLVLGPRYLGLGI